MNEIKRLVVLARFTGDGLKRTVILLFASGFLDHITLELLHLPNIENMTMREYIVRISESGSYR